MSNDYIDLAKAYSSAGYSVIPVTKEKVPAIRDWSVFQTRPMTNAECEKYFKNVFGIALLCGGEKKITGIDGDFKYDLRGDAFDRFKEAIPNELLSKFYYQTTMNKGAHLVFFCDKVEPNQKLACRHTTAFEKHQTYMEAFNTPALRDKALKIAQNDRSRVIWETRGGDVKKSGGFILIAPTPGYEHKYGKIQELSVEEYDVVMNALRSFNEVIEEQKDLRLDKYKEWELSPFADFNERGDIVSLLEDNGWEIVRGGSKKSIRWKRAGNPSSASSALLNLESRKFNVFSTSTSFDVNKAYSPSSIFIHLECDDDVSLAFKKLVELEYGKEL